MKGIIGRALGVVSFAACLASTGGCYYYDQLVDPCYPERYTFKARKEVCDALAPQVQNGHVLDQTVWNWYFEPGTATLNTAGEQKLLYLIRRRPHPDPVIYLASAQDIEYVPGKVEEFAKAQVDLNNQRLQSVQDYLAAQTAGRNLGFQLVVHDPAEPYLPSQAMQAQMYRLLPSFQGTLFGASGSVLPGADTPGGIAGGR